MEMLYSAKRLGHTTKLRWLVYNDDQYTGYVIDDKGVKFPVNSDDLNSHYSGDVDIRISAKVDSSIVRVKSSDTPVQAKSKNKEKVNKSKVEPKKAKTKKVKPSNSVQANKFIIHDESDKLPSFKPKMAPNYHKDIFILSDSDSDFSIEVDGTLDVAESLLRELSSKHKNLVITKRTIRTMTKKLDEYYIIEHRRDGKLIFEMDFDLFEDADNIRVKRKSQYPNDEIYIHHVEEILS